MRAPGPSGDNSTVSATAGNVARLTTPAPAMRRACNARCPGKLVPNVRSGSLATSMSDGASCPSQSIALARWAAPHLARRCGAKVPEAARSIDRISRRRTRSNSDGSRPSTTVATRSSVAIAARSSAIVSASASGLSRSPSTARSSVETAARNLLSTSAGAEEFDGWPRPKPNGGVNGPPSNGFNDQAPSNSARAVMKPSKLIPDSFPRGSTPTSPKASYCARSAGSESTWNAWRISSKRSRSPPHVSGCTSSALRRQAARTARGEAPGSRPKRSKKRRSTTGCTSPVAFRHCSSNCSWSPRTLKRGITQPITSVRDGRARPFGHGFGRICCGSVSKI
mmetsp:Transcript_65385/g.181868  ORF Transcript_65385/g.181868 Transcript_65385/m.181868 type:complete len:338 (-) Transcript_65385:812-1825(-)